MGQAVRGAGGQRPVGAAQRGNGGEPVCETGVVALPGHAKPG
jgi:hypothetical protein